MHGTMDLVSEFNVSDYSPSDINHHKVSSRVRCKRGVVLAQISRSSDGVDRSTLEGSDRKSRRGLKA